MSYPSLYEYYTSNGINEGLSTKCRDYFTLNHRPIQIFSGAIHYFRVPPQYWRDRLRKSRAAGLNCIETYIAWNLHQPDINSFDFSDGDCEFSQFLNIREFLKIAQEEDLFVIIRPGPYICAEWEFGGLPSWLLRYDLKIRTHDQKFIKFVCDYFKVLLSILAPLQFTKGGPIILLQIENEYGDTKIDDKTIDTRYLVILKEILEDHGIVELFCTCGTPSQGFFGSLPNILSTANFQKNPIKELTLLRNYQPDKPLLVMEYWTGWYDHWMENHHKRDLDDFTQILHEIINFKASVNLYMFHGGTNWCFYNGADISDKSKDNSKFQPLTTSYDYDAPLSEAGDYTDKYFKVKELIEKYNTIKTRIPPMPSLIKRIAYPSVKITEKLTICDLINQSKWSEISKNLKSMEFLDFNRNSGQSYGYIVYRKQNLKLPPNSTLKIEGHVCDTVMVLIDGILKSPPLNSQEDLNNFGYWRLKDSTLHLNNSEVLSVTLDLIVENWGRCNYGKLDQFNQYKGLWQGGVLLNNEILEDFQIIPLEFRKCWLDSLVDWQVANFAETGPNLYRTVFDIGGDIRDSFIDMRGWCKGFVAVNGFMLGRYLKLGPQQSLYLPAPFLRQNNNVLMIFEHFSFAKLVGFLSDPIYNTSVMV